MGEISRSWSLYLNPTKCVVMRFGSRSAYESGSNSGYRLDGVPLNLVRTHRDLGVLIDSSLRFHPHVASIVQKASSLINQILRSTVCRSSDFMVTLFVSHIRPLIDYSSTVWNMGYLMDIRRLESLQRRWTREVAGFEVLEYGIRLRRLGLFSVYGRLLRVDLIKIWKAFHPEVDVGLVIIFDREFHSATRGHRFKLSKPRCHSEIRRRFLNVRVVDTWNSLPAAIVEADTLGSFKSQLDKHMGDLFFRFL